MTKLEQAAVRKARELAKKKPADAATELAAVHKVAETSRSKRELFLVMMDECLLQYLVVVDGAFVSRV